MPPFTPVNGNRGRYAILTLTGGKQNVNNIFYLNDRKHMLYIYVPYADKRVDYSFAQTGVLFYIRLTLCHRV